MTAGARSRVVQAGRSWRPAGHRDSSPGLTPARIRERFRAWADSGATGLTINTKQDEALELIADLAETAHVG